jgi:NADH dehydrogenase (ubiquinone) Fe-S protein 2
MRESLNIIYQSLFFLKNYDFIKNDSIYLNNNKFLPPVKSFMKYFMESLIHHFKFFSYGFSINKDEVYSVIEAPKGEFGVFLVSNNTNKPYRCHIKAPGFLHLQGLDFMSKKSYLSDLVTIIGTQDIVFGEVDR